MEVKIYREPENEALIVDEEQLQEYKALLKELNLEAPADIDQKRVPNIYIHMNKTMAKQLQAVCPDIKEIKEYKRSTIPLEVLKVYQFALQNKMFEGFDIWFNSKDPDPMLIGWNYLNNDDRDNNYTWRKSRTLIARWGDCALELPELLQLGFDKIKQQLLDKTAKGKDLCESILKDPDRFVRDAIDEKSVSFDLNTSVNKSIY